MFTNIPPRMAFWPPILLKRSNRSRARSKVLYSANVSEQFGLRAHQGLYIEWSALPTIPPWHIEMMVFFDAPPRPGDYQHVVTLVRDPVDRETKVAYNASGASAKIVRSVYLPVTMFSGAAPGACYLTINFR